MFDDPQVVPLRRRTRAPAVSGRQARERGRAGATTTCAHRRRDAAAARPARSAWQRFARLSHAPPPASSVVVPRGAATTPPVTNRPRPCGGRPRRSRARAEHEEVGVGARCDELGHRASSSRKLAQRIRQRFGNPVSRPPDGHSPRSRTSRGGDTGRPGTGPTLSLGRHAEPAQFSAVWRRSAAATCDPVREARHHVRTRPGFREPASAPGGGRSPGAPLGARASCWST